jgi:flagellar protein FlgJ
MLGEARKTDFGNTLLSNEGTQHLPRHAGSNMADTIAKRGTLGFAKMSRPICPPDAHPRRN